MCKSFISGRSVAQVQIKQKTKTERRPRALWWGVKSVWMALTLIGLFSLLAHHAQAQANCDNIACVTSGPHLANIDEQQNVLLNRLLGNLSGADLNLSVLDSNALAQANISESDLLNQLQTQLGVASPQDVLTSSVTLGQVIQALTQVTTDTATINALNVLALSPNLPTTGLQLGDLLQSSTSDGSLSNVDLNVLDLLTGSIQLLNSQNVVTTPTPITISGNELGLGNLINTITLQAQVVEPPVYVCGDVGAQFYSAGIRLKLHVDLVDTSLVTTGLSPVLNGLLGLVYNIDVDATVGQVDLYVDVARGSGTITSLNAVSKAVTIQATPGVADIYLGTIQNATFFDRAHTIVPATDLDFANLATLGITLTPKIVGSPIQVSTGIEAKSFANGDNPTEQTLNFVAPYPSTQTATTSATFVDDLVTDLVTNLQVRLAGSLGGILDPLLNGLALNNLLDAIRTSLIGAINDTNALPLDSLLTDLVDPLLANLGVSLGKMDVTVNSVGQICDTDNDGIPDALDSDDDGDGILDTNEGNGAVDSDMDGTPDSLDADSDNDTVPDAVEAFDVNHDGQPDRAPSGHDVDHDGIDDAFDVSQGGVVAPLPDTDNDGKPDYRDADDDADGINTILEDANGDHNPRNDDTDGDGRPNYLDPANANACLPNAGSLACPTGDNDGDGTPNGTDPEPTNPCVPNANALACATGDADGDGTPNGSDPAPTNPCVPNANSTACQNDTDGDGTPNGTDPEPNNPCVPNANAVACPTGDADGDGTPNGADPAPLNPCVPNANNAACTTGDTDNDGTPNGSDPAPTNPCIPNANTVNCATGDTDNDGTPNGTDPAPTDPCVPNANAIACTTGDNDGDGTPNGTDPAPTNPCVPNANSVACQNDTDGDGTTNSGDPSPSNPCVPNANAAACTTGDSDGDGTPNGSDPGPLNPCVPNANAAACTTGDSDGDSIPNNNDPATNDPCVPNASSLACQISNQGQRKLYLPLLAR
ncbi:MAG: hypothetical protein NT075_26955 [Chloroflexi bacterium]|nr:hypothetical protein [Chloroflexota bacterium]